MSLSLTENPLDPPSKAVNNHRHHHLYLKTRFRAVIYLIMMYL